MEIYILGVIFLFVIFIGVNFTRINGFGSNSNGKNFKIKNDKLNSEINIYKGYSEPEKDIPIAKEDVQDLELPYVVLAKALNTLQTTPINKLVKSQIPPKVDIFRPETLPPNTELLVKKQAQYWLNLASMSNGRKYTALTPDGVEIYQWKDIGMTATLYDGFIQDNGAVSGHRVLLGWTTENNINPKLFVARLTNADQRAYEPMPGLSSSHNSMVQSVHGIHTAMVERPSNSLLPPINPVGVRDSRDRPFYQDSSDSFEFSTLEDRTNRRTEPTSIRNPNPKVPGQELAENLPGTRVPGRQQIFAWDKTSALYTEEPAPGKTNVHSGTVIAPLHVGFNPSIGVTTPQPSGIQSQMFAQDYGIPGTIYP